MSIQWELYSGSFRILFNISPQPILLQELNVQNLWKPIGPFGNRSFGRPFHRVLFAKPNCKLVDYFKRVSFPFLVWLVRILN